MSGQSCLEAKELKKIYKGRAVVDGVSLVLKSSTITGLLGPNGAGKTTTFYMIAGLIRPDGGQVFLDDTEITHMPMHKRANMGITYLPQEPSVFRKLTVFENIEVVFENRGLPKKERKERVEELLEDMGLTSLAKQKAESLSGGERRRVEVARALATDPKFVLLDEPFAGVDPLAVADIQGIIKELRGRGIGIFLSDHNVRETLTVCDSAYIVSSGKVIEYGSPEKIATSEIARKIYLGEEFSL
ncbi:MAG: LPS export ABC transporter ATP-binding protein [Thermodesulfobacteria bacterium]|nr:LPS export ABC transporter ATP-binding protein [Thermodesulfobacteriota bacterium]